MPFGICLFFSACKSRIDKVFKTFDNNFSGVIAFDFASDVVANTVFGSHETKETYQDPVTCSNGNK